MLFLLEDSIMQRLPVTTQEITVVVAAQRIGTVEVVGQGAWGCGASAPVLPDDNDFGP